MLKPLAYANMPKILPMANRRMLLAQGYMLMLLDESNHPKPKFIPEKQRKRNMTKLLTKAIVAKLLTKANVPQLLAKTIMKKLIY
ncbi:hypothetical protein M0802_011332 [Mischocyttarus mexicanus]|nr:hypothetical protein M0802_011332 [Mischocyttarus mexicanus]